MTQNAFLKVKTTSQRPDFRVFNAYLFGDDFHPCDTDGNSQKVYSRDWTQLYMASRQTPELWFDICEENNQNTDILIISSDSEAVVNRIAYFLAKETKGEIFDQKNQPINADSLKDKMGDFDLENRLQMAKNSIWRTSSEQNPYPNLKND